MLNEFEVKVDLNICKQVRKGMNDDKPTVLIKPTFAIKPTISILKSSTLPSDSKTPTKNIHISVSPMQSLDTDEDQDAASSQSNQAFADLEEEDVKKASPIKSQTMANIRLRTVFKGVQKKKSSLVKAAGTFQATLKKGNASMMKAVHYKSIVSKDTLMGIAKSIDQNGQNVFHRAATFHNLRLLINIVTDMEDEEDLKYSIEEQINAQSKYGETPLLIACMLLQSDSDENLRYEFISYLLENDAHANCYNRYTYWTPMHWAARHGDLRLMDMLLRKKAKTVTPDYKGSYPIDYAGKFDHKGAVKRIVDYSIDMFDKLIEANLDQQKSVVIVENSWQRKQKRKRYVLLDYEDAFLISPGYATSLLYWSAQTSTVERGQVQKILNQMESYPEGTLAIESELQRTPCHSVAIGGDTEKMKLIYQDFNDRYAGEDITENILGQVTKKCPIPLLQEKFNKILNDSLLKKMKAYQNNVFWPELRKKHKLKDFQFQNFFDSHKNTPLHLAAMNNNEHATFLLSTEYESSIDATNTDGILAKDIGKWHPGIKRIFTNFFDKFDEHIQEISKQEPPDDVNDKLSNSYRKRTFLKEQRLFKRVVRSEAARRKMADDPQAVADILVQRKFIRNIPHVVLKLFSDNAVRRKMLNDFLKQVKKEKIPFSLIKSVDKGVFYATIELEMEQIEQHAIKMEFPVKVNDLSAKVPFKKDWKEKVIPFRSKDIQTITINKLNCTFDIESLKERGVLLKLVPMHFEKNLFFMREKYNRRKYVPHAFTTFKTYYMEDIHSELATIVAYKNYFGEKKCIQQCFFEFFTIWMMVPAFFAGILWIYQAQFAFETRWIFIFAIGISFWTTVMIERWKRKEHFIAYKWGLSEKDQDNEIKINPSFLGFHKFSWSSNQFLGKKSTNLTDKLFSVLSLIISVTLILFSLSVEISLKNRNFTINLGNEQLTNKFKASSAGLLISIITSTVNFIYKYVAKFMTDKQNHKYLQDKDRSLMLNMVIFKLINTNATIILAVVQIVSSQDDEAFDKDGNEIEKIKPLKFIYDLIMIVVTIKAVSPLFTRYGFRYGKFQLYKWNYFRKVAEKGRAQANKYKKNKNLIDENYFNTRNNVTFFLEKNLNNNNKKITQADQTKNKYGQLAPENSESAISNQSPTGSQLLKVSDTKSDLDAQLKRYTSVPSPIFQRIVLESDNTHTENISIGDVKKQVLIDHIEVNALMPIKSDVEQIYDLTERYQMMAFSMLYAGICPPATLIVFLHFIMDTTLGRYTDMYCIQRPLQDFQQTMGPWNEVAEYIIFSVIVVNALMIYLLSESLNEKMEEDFNLNSHTVFIFVIITEHILLFITGFIKSAIPDIPRKLIKLQERTATEVTELREVVKPVNDSKQTIRDLKSELEKMRSENEQLRSQLPKEESKHQRALKIINHYEKKKSEILNKKARLVDFLDMDPRQNLFKETCDVVNSELNVNLEIKLYRETFLLIERAILQRKLSALYNTNKVLLINCTECSSDMSTVYCQDCEDHFCTECSESFHFAGSPYEKHSTVSIRINPTGLVPGGPKQSAVQGVEKSNSSVKTQWRKFEDFNFPLSESSDLFFHFKVHFMKLKRAYINFNYIDEFNGQIDFASLFVAQNYDSLEREQGREMKKKHAKQYGRRSLIVQKEIVEGTESFNEEELYYFNRIAFKLMKQKGSTLRLEHLVEDLKTLQYGPFSDRLRLWLDCVFELEEDVQLPHKKRTEGQNAEESKSSMLNTDSRASIISKVKFNNVIRSSFPQDVTMKTSFETVTDTIFSGGLDDYKSLESIHHFIMGDEQAKSLLYCILQYNDDETESQDGF